VTDKPSSLKLPNCQVLYWLQPLQSKTGQLWFGTTTTCTRKSLSPTIPIRLTRPFLHPHRIPNPAPISLSLDSSRLHYSFVPFRITLANADPRVWMHPIAMHPLFPWNFPQLWLVSYATRFICSSNIFLCDHHIKAVHTFNTVLPNPLHSCIFSLRDCNVSFGPTIFHTASCI
jgi:hypothetical protein